MSKSVPGNQKHLDLDQRVKIEKGLDDKLSFRQIAKDLQKDPSTIAKEVRNHQVKLPHNNSYVGLRHFNGCANMKGCDKRNVCNQTTTKCTRLCKTCHRCNQMCSDFAPKSFHCELLDKPPYVCNGCDKKRSCRLDKIYYRAVSAEKEYRLTLVESRQGIDISEDDLKILDELVAPLIQKGQSIYTILNNHPEIDLCEKTLYNYVDAGALSVKNIDLPKKVKYKVRNVHKSEINDKGIFENRTYKDYLGFLEEFPDTPVVEMDTVVGCEGSSKVLMTWHFTSCDYMCAFLLPNKEAKNVKRVFNRVEKAITSIQFSQYFSIILTDRGGEFSDPAGLETGTDGVIRTSIYYCDPMASWQKPHCERNHEYIRKIAPKGTSFDNYTQYHITKMMNNINNSPRESLGGMTPMQLAKQMLPKELLEYLDSKFIEKDDIILTPALFTTRQIMTGLFT